MTMHISKGNKLGIIDRFTRTFKNMLIQYMETYDTRNYSDAVDKLVDSYNNSKHSSIGARMRRSRMRNFRRTKMYLSSRNAAYNAGIRPAVGERG
jgi:hypothetical protein